MAGEAERRCVGETPKNPTELICGQPWWSWRLGPDSTYWPISTTLPSSGTHRNETPLVVNGILSTILINAGNVCVTCGLHIHGRLACNF